MSINISRLHLRKRLFNIEQIELFEELLDILLRVMNAINNYWIQKVLFSDIATTVEIHGGVGFVRATKDVTEFTTKYLSHWVAQVMPTETIQND